jgi:flagellar biosynthetic protein FliR
MNILTISPIHLQLFLLIFLRVSAVLVLLPLFDSKSIPVIFKAGLALTVSITLFPLVDIGNVSPITDVFSFGIKVGGEIMLGAIIGLSVKLVFAGVQLAGQLAGFQMGFAIANVMDPVTSTQASIMAQLKNYMAMLIFLAMDAHHALLQALAQSFEIVRPLAFHFSTSVADQIMNLASTMFVIALKVGAPLLSTLFLTSVGLGLIARTVPQMNIFIVAMPLKILVGLLFLAFAFPFIATLLGQLFNGMGESVVAILYAAR